MCLREQDALAKDLPSRLSLLCSILDMPPLLMQPQEAQVAGNLMVLLLVAGLSLGALAGFAWLL